MIQPVFLYTAPIWGGASAFNINEIETIENKMLRMISNAHPTESNIEIEKILDINEIDTDIYNRTYIFYTNSVKQIEIFFFYFIYLFGSWS